MMDFNALSLLGSKEEPTGQEFYNVEKTPVPRGGMSVAPNAKKPTKDNSKILDTALATAAQGAAGLLGRRGHVPSLPGGAVTGAAGAAQAQGMAPSSPGVDPTILMRILGRR